MQNSAEAKSSLRVMPRVNKILERSPNFEDRIIRDYAELRDVVEVLKAMGKKIVMTNGVYDLQHNGHWRYLARAKEHGDILVVAVDTDQITRKRKPGTRRPIDSEEDRMESLLHTRYVDIITLRNVMPGENDDIEAVVPHVLITSETTKDFPEGVKKKLTEEMGIEIVVLPPQASTSTTARIRLLMVDGAQELGRVVTGAISDYIGSFEEGK